MFQSFWIFYYFSCFDWVINSFKKWKSTSLHVCTDIKNKAYVVLYWQSFDLKFCSSDVFWRLTCIVLLSVSTKVSHKRVLKIDWKRRDCCLLYTSPSPRDQRGSRMPSSAWKKKLFSRKQISKTSQQIDVEIMASDLRQA